MARISKAKAALILKVVPRTIGRWVESGDLHQEDDGTFDRDEVEELAGILEADKPQGESETVQCLSILKTMCAQLMDHNERMLKNLEAPTKSVLTTLENMNVANHARISALESERIANMEMISDLYTNHSQSKAAEVQAEARAKMLSDASPVVKMALARLVSKALPGEPVKLESVGTPAKPQDNAVGKFFASLDESQRAMLLGAGPMIAEGDEQLTLFKQAMAELGLKEEESNNAKAQ